MKEPRKHGIISETMRYQDLYLKNHCEFVSQEKTNLCSTMFFKDIHWKTGWWFQIFGIFTPIVGEMIQFEEHIFPMGWNNQLALLLPSPLVVDGTLKLPKIQKIGKFSYGPIAFFVWRGCVFDILINVVRRCVFCCLFSKGDDTVPSDMGILISHHMNPYQPTRIPWTGMSLEDFERCWHVSFSDCNQQVLGCPAGT